MSPTLNTQGGALIAKGLVRSQLIAMGLCIIVSLVLTWIIGTLVQKTIGLRCTDEEESQGLDIADHGEEGYQHNQ